MKLTAKIVCSYPNSEVMYLDIPTRCAGVNHEEDMLLLRTAYGMTGQTTLTAVDADKCQLILTPLDKISDEDAKQICIIGGNDRSDDVYKVRNGKELVTKYWRTVTNVSADIWVDIINYLRSRSYDTDNLIAAGVAVEKEIV